MSESINLQSGVLNGSIASALLACAGADFEHFVTGR
ncbi:MAG: hypothetical protein JWN69_1886 [Alphaproteobacteria bacterium]|nr:hypothetical protein [Alphaproteobacteria bacterium]